MNHSLCDMTEIIPGYSPTERIGAGGYGEVWKVNAPGGLKKALKIVYGFVGEERAEREWKALERIKSIRHPYILSLERVEVLQHRLLIVSELADCSLLDRFRECRRKNLTGIPRDELLRYLREAAEALDFLLQQHGLQHLDIKPENLLLLCDHAKVADFGLVKDLFDQAHSLVSGLTPIYAAPETFHGTASRWSDQYSLAVVYQQMLTGTLPYPGRQAAQLVSQHAKLPPALTALPTDDRVSVARALQLRPEARFESCSAFIQALSTPTSVKSTASTVGSSTPYGASSSEKDTCSMKGILTDIVARERPRLEDRAVTEKRSAEQGADSVAEISSAPVADGVEVPRIRVSRRIRRLKPLQPSVLPAVEPAVFIGVGGTGARILSKLQSRLEDGAFEEGRAPRFLLMDTDTRTIQGATKESDALTLTRSDCLDLPLRRPEEFLRESDRYLAWLSRRWLYNIRPSLATNGMRPLGRLAWFDHRERIERELRARLTPDSKDGSRCPNVFLVGSIAGGTGGMLLDVAKSISSQLQDAGGPPPRVTALLVHSTTSHPQQRDLANANAFATLNELRHLCCHGETINPKVSHRATNKPNEKWDPLLATYFISLGQNLDESGYSTGIGEIAEYLWENIRSPLGGLLHSLRKHDSPVAAHDVALRSFKCYPMKVPSGTKEELAEFSRILQAANVPLPNCGYDQRLIFLLPEKLKPPTAWLEWMRQVADIIASPHDTPFLCCEAEKLSLAQVAHSLCEECTDVEEAAYRLHVRRDIDWSRMTQVQTIDV